MPAQGASTDILTGKPHELSAKLAAEEAKQNEDARLRRQAEWAAVMGSEAGMRIYELICELLQARIEKILQEDPESKAYLAMLQRLGEASQTGRKAMKKLAERHFPQA
jgi:hypothetical protein